MSSEQIMRHSSLALVFAFSTPALFAFRTISKLSYRNHEIRLLRKEITHNLRTFKHGDAIQIKWRYYRIVKNDNFFKIMAKTMQNHDTLSSVNRLASLYDIIPGQRWLIPNMRGIAVYGSLRTIRKKYRKIAKPIQVPGKKNLWFLAGAEFNPEERKYFNLKIFIRPVAGKISSKYGRRRDPFTKKSIFHRGIDIACHNNSKVKASAGGKVIHREWLGGYGHTIIIQHQNGYQTLYGHLNSYKVKKGARVKQGQLIALSGSTGRSTGPHLHFEVRRKGRSTRPSFHFFFKNLDPD